MGEGKKYETERFFFIKEKVLLLQDNKSRMCYYAMRLPMERVMRAYKWECY